MSVHLHPIAAQAEIFFTLFAPTLVGMIYKMNFKHMPELDWQLGYPMAIGMMFTVGAAALRRLQAARLDLMSRCHEIDMRTGRSDTRVT